MAKPSSVRWAILLGVALILLAVTLTVGWILVLSRARTWGLLAVGSTLFGLILVGLVLYMVLTTKEVRLNQRQTNFMDSITHELKSPLTSLRLYLETLLLRPVPPDQQQTFHRYMLDDVERLDALINHLLEAARVDRMLITTPMTGIDLEPLVRTCALKVCHRYGLAPTAISVEAEPATVRGHKAALEMVFRNLLDNAIKYSGREPQVSVRIAPAGTSWVWTEVSDNGVGIPPNRRRQVFARFVRGGNELERTRIGTGLGLYIVRTLIQQMKGTIQIRDRAPLPGTTFRVELPRHRS